MDDPVGYPLRRQATWPFTVAQFIDQLLGYWSSRPAVVSSEQRIRDLINKIDQDFNVTANEWLKRTGNHGCVLAVKSTLSSPTLMTINCSTMTSKTYCHKGAPVAIAKKNNK